MWKLAPIVLLVAGCKLYGASDSSTETLTITSEPQGIKVNVDGQTLTTPAMIEIAQRRSHIVTFPNGEKPFSSATTTAIRHCLPGW